MEHNFIAVSRYWRSLMGPQPLCAPESYLAHWLKVTHRQISIRFGYELRMWEMSPAEWAVLREMYRPRRLSPVVLAEVTGISKGTASKLVDRLVQRGLVEKMTSEFDARVRGVQLTSRGEVVVRSLAQSEEDVDREFFGPLPQKTRAKLMQILKEIAFAQRRCISIDYED
jgi:DNA-binding MarR family transcriptional regulator